jgi:hypothetical protein
MEDDDKGSYWPVSFRQVGEVVSGNSGLELAQSPIMNLKQGHCYQKHIHQHLILL